MTSRKTYLLELGVFDDFDVVPTLITGFLIPYEDLTDDQLRDALCAYAEEVRDVAEQQYGSKFPHSAEFWFCSVQEQEIDDDQLRDQVQREGSRPDGAEADDVQDLGADQG